MGGESAARGSGTTRERATFDLRLYGPADGVTEDEAVNIVRQRGRTEPVHAH